MNEEHFDTTKRIREKQEARDKDERDLVEGKVTAEELQRRNSLFSGFDLSKAKFIVLNPMS